MRSRIWLLAALALVSLMTTAAKAQVVPPSDLPGRERQRFIQPQAPQSQPAGPVVTLPSTVAPAGADKVFVLVEGVEVTGSTVYDKKQFAELYAGMVGQRVSLAAVYALAQKITSRYGNDGYVLSRAIVPPQQLSPNGAIVHIEVIEGYIDRVEWPPQLHRYRDFFTAYAAKITAARPVNIRTIERYLLLAGDLPGLKFKTSLRPSEAARGAATLVVEVAEKRIDANAHIDNRGTPARGPFEYYGSATLNNLFGQHEAWTFTYAGVVPLKELNYAALGYKQVLTSEGLTFFADGSYAWGTPGTAQLENSALPHPWSLRRCRLLLSGAAVARKKHHAVEPGLRQQQRKRGDRRTIQRRSSARLSQQSRRRLRRSMAGDQSVQRHVQQGHPGAGQHHQQQPARLAAGGTRRLRQDRSHGGPHPGAVRPLLGLCVALRPVCRHAAPCARTVRVRRPLFRPRLRSVAADWRLLLRNGRRTALRPAGQNAALRQYGAVLRLHRLRRSLHAGCFRGELRRSKRRPPSAAASDLTGSIMSTPTSRLREQLRGRATTRGSFSF